MNTKSKILAVGLLAGLLHIATQASAQIMPITPDLGWSMSINAGYAILSDATLRSVSGDNRQNSSAGTRGRSQDSRAASRPAPAVNTRFTPTHAGRGLDAMAARYTASERAVARQKMQQLYDVWPQMARQLDVPANDMGSALTAYLVGSWMAYNNVDYPDAQFKLAAEQMRHVLSEFPDFANLSDADRQFAHEQLVTLGVMVAVARQEQQQNPDPAIRRDLQQLAGQNLRNFLQTYPSRVHFRSDGLMVIR